MVVWYDNVKETDLGQKVVVVGCSPPPPRFEAEITTRDLRVIGSNRKIHISSFSFERASLPNHVFPNVLGEQEYKFFVVNFYLACLLITVALEFIFPFVGN